MSVCEDYLFWEYFKSHNKLFMLESNRDKVVDSQDSMLPQVVFA